jgi:hypothetical protein
MYLVKVYIHEENTAFSLVAIKETCLEVNVEKTKYMCMP